MSRQCLVGIAYSSIMLNKHLMGYLNKECARQKAAYDLLNTALLLLFVGNMKFHFVTVLGFVVCSNENFVVKIPANLV